MSDLDDKIYSWLIGYLPSDDAEQLSSILTPEAQKHYRFQFFTGLVVGLLISIILKLL